MRGRAPSTSSSRRRRTAISSSQPPRRARARFGMGRRLSTCEDPGPLRTRSGRLELVHDSIGFFPLRSALRDVDAADLRSLLQVRAAARAVVRRADLDDPQSTDGFRDEVQESAILDLVLDDDAVLLE